MDGFRETMEELCWCVMVEMVRESNSSSAPQPRAYRESRLGAMAHAQQSQMP
jgi:hypothetical protein